jgi:hypothetical protein
MIPNYRLSAQAQLERDGVNKLSIKMQLYSSHPNKRKKGEKEGNKEIISD